MKEIIPLKKDIIFKTRIGEITSIDIEHTYNVEDDLVSGDVILSGTYKMTEASVLDEEFYYKIPFSIAITKRVNKDTINIEIEDFTYEIQKDVLKVDIKLELTCEEEEDIKEEAIETLDFNNDKEDFEDNDFMKEYFENDNNINNEDNIVDELNNNINVNENTKMDVEVNENKTDVDLNENINNITNNIINNENKYYTYKIYIVRDGDTIESICNKYNVTLNDLKDYNNVNNVNVGDKIIIPQINE